MTDLQKAIEKDLRISRSTASALSDRLGHDEYTIEKILIQMQEAGKVSHTKFGPLIIWRLYIPKETQHNENSNRIQEQL